MAPASYSGIRFGLLRRYRERLSSAGRRGAGRRRAARAQAGGGEAGEPGRPARS